MIDKIVKSMQKKDNAVNKIIDNPITITDEEFHKLSTVKK